MALLLEPPIEVEWSAQAGPMSWIDPGPAPLDGPLPELRWETAYWLDELEASQAPPPPQLATAEAGWAVPGVFHNEAPPPRPAPSPDVQALRRVVQRLEASDPSALPPEQALADLEELLRTDETLRIARLARLTDAQIRKLAHTDGAPSLNSWVRRRFDDAPRTDIPLADTLRPHPHLRRQVSTRKVGVEAAHLVGRVLKKLRHHLDRPDGLIDGQPSGEVIAAVVGNIVPLIAAARLGLDDDDPLLVALVAKVEEIVAAPDSELGKLEIAFSLMGEHIPLRLLKLALDEQVDAVLPNLLEQRAEQGADTRNLRIDRDRAYGGGRIGVDATDELMELAETVLGAEVRRDPENPADTDATRKVRETSLHGDVLEPDDVEADHDVRSPRTKGQRLHDALVLVFQNYLAAGLAGSHDKVPVAVTVLLPLEKLEKRSGALPAKGGSGRRLPASLVGRWWCDATISSLVLTQGLIPLGITHEQRTLTAVERKASRVQHGQACSGLRCCTPHDPLTTLVPHHVYAYSKFGKTSIVDTVWLCHRLHDAIHRGKTVGLRNGRWLNGDGWTRAPLIVNY